MRLTVVGLLLCALVSLSSILAQDARNAVNNTCTFADHKQMSVRYEGIASDSNSASLMPSGKVWAPSGTPMYLFTQVDLMLGNSSIPTGAYALYLIADKGKWTLIVNKNVTQGSSYQQQDDLMRIPMEMGQLGTAAHFKVFFAHVAPKQCNMRIYFGKTGGWVEFKEE